MNIIDRIKFLFFYKKTLDTHREELFSKFNIKIDLIYRMYTVVSIEPEEYHAYGGGKSINYKNDTLEELLSEKTGSGKIMNGEDFFKQKVKSYENRLDKYLISIGLVELYGLLSKVKIDTYNYKVVVGYKYLSTELLANLAVLLGLTLISSTIIGIILAIFL